jgi:hypothetical protein
MWVRLHSDGSEAYLKRLADGSSPRRDGDGEMAWR